MSKVKIQGNASGTANFTIASPATNTDRTITLPDVDATVLTTAGGTISGRTTVKDDINSDKSYPFGIQNGSQDQWWLRAETTSNRFSIHKNGLGNVIEADAAGRVTMPFQPSFEVGGSAGLTFTVVSGSDHFKVIYPTIHHNVGNHYNTSTGHFTAPVAGVYLFTAVMMGIAVTGPHITFSINGSTQGGGLTYPFNNMFVHSGSNDTNTISTTHIIKLSAGDYVRVQSYAYSSVGSSDRCYFGGHLLG